jgi:hypothetical protein
MAARLLLLTALVLALTGTGCMSSGSNSRPDRFMQTQMNQNPIPSFDRGSSDDLPDEIGGPE